MCYDKFSDYNLFFKIFQQPVCEVDVGRSILRSCAVFKDAGNADVEEDDDLSAFEGAETF